METAATRTIRSMNTANDTRLMSTANDTRLMSTANDTRLMSTANDTRLMSTANDTRLISTANFGLSRTLLQVITEKGWEFPSQVQKATLEAALKGQDILARVKDDAGAFLISCIEMIDTDLDAIQALIIVPTRELATQIGKLCAELSKHLNVKVMASIGASGIPITESSKLNFTPHILITLPERAIDFIEKRVAIVDQCKFLVLNETGKLSAEALNRLAGHLPQQRQTLLFFETFNIEISEFAVKHLNNAFEFELMQGQSEAEWRAIAEYLHSDRDKRPLVSNKRHINDKNFSYYLYCVVKKSASLQQSNVVKCGVTFDAYARWGSIVIQNTEIDYETHQMLILHKITTDKLSDSFYSTHQYSRVLERALFSFAADFNLIKEDAKAGDGQTEDPLNQRLLTQEHIAFVKQLLVDSFANPHYVTVSDCKDKYDCLKCGAIRFTLGSINYHQMKCTGSKNMKVSSDDDQPQSSIGIKRKQEIPKKASNRRALDLFYASVRDTTIWSDALAQWKQMPDDKKKPFTDQAAAELDQYYNDMQELGIKPEKKLKPEGAPKRPPRAYDLWVRDGNGERIKEAKPADAKGNWFQKTTSAEWEGLSDEAKQPYKDQHKILMEKYNVKCAEASEREENQD